MEILKVPKLNENMEAAMVGPWSKSVGDQVQEGEVIVELITDKASFELQAGENGILRVAAAREKSTIPVGYALAIIAGEDESVPDIASDNAALMESYARQVRVDVTATPAARVRATPAARRLARERGVDLADVATTVRDGSVVDRKAVERFIGS